MKNYFSACVIACICIALTSSGRAQDKIYYTISTNPTYTVNVANIDGTSPHALFADDGVQSPNAIALDLTNNKVYYSDIGHHALRKCNLDGTGITDVMTGIDIYYFALDVAAGKIYYTISANPTYTVNVANIDGTNPHALFADDGVQSPKDIALDLTNNKIYFSDNGHHAIRKCNMDGTGLTNVMTGIDIFYFALDVAGGKIYYTISANPTYTVNVANIDGTNPHTLFADDGVQSPKDIALDLVNSKIYYIDAGHKSIRRCGLDGSSITDLITSITPTAVVTTTTNPPLPVEITSFTASAAEGKALLNWETATEVNNYGFEIQRTLTGDSSWVKVGFVKGAGYSNSTREYSFTDKPEGGRKFKYRLKQIDVDGKFEYSSVVEVELNIGTDLAVAQNYPNPFNPTTRINFTIPADNRVEVKVFNPLGEEVATLLNERKQAGTYTVEFNAGNLPSGVYFYKIVSGNYTEVKKMILLK